MRNSPTFRGVLALVGAGVLWGSTFLVIQDAIDQVSVASFLAVRFLVGAAVLWPVARRRPSSPGEIRHGVLAGVCLGAAFLAQTEGLRSTTAATSAFITYLLVVLVPVIVAIRTRRLPTLAVIIGVVVAVLGLAALTGAGTGGGRGALLSGLGRGEVLTVAGALGFALHLVILSSLSIRHDPVRLTLWQVLTVGSIYLVPGLFSAGGYHFGSGPLVAAVFCGVGATAIAFFLMAWGQRVVPPSQAALILLLEPVSAGVLGEFTGEHLGQRGLLGAGLILIAVLVAELGDRRPTQPAAELTVPAPSG